MQLHQIKPNHKKKTRKLVGRGGKHGTYSGRGMKGQNSRSGSSTRPGFEGGQTPFFRRLPKQRGATKVVDVNRAKKLGRYQIKPVVLNLSKINQFFQSGEIVSPRTLEQKGLIGKTGNKLPAVKILGDGKLAKKLVFEDCVFSKSAGKKISDKISKQMGH